MVTLNRPVAGDTDWATEINTNWSSIEALLNGQIIVVKPADESVVSSTTLQDDDHLKFSIGANETWQFDAVLFIEIASSGPDMKLAFGGPGTPSTFRAHVQGWNRYGDTLAANGQTLIAYESADPAQVWDEDYGGAVTSMIVIRGSVFNGATSGTVVIKWAQRVSSATATKVMKGSYIKAQKL